GINVVAASPEPQSAAGILPADQSEESTAGKMPAAAWRCRLTGRKFMVPIHGKQAEEASHEPRSSGRESAHSQRYSGRRVVHPMVHFVGRPLHLGFYSPAISLS